MTVFEGPRLDDTPGIGALTLGSFLLEVTARFGEREALVFDDPLHNGETVRWTYADLERESRAVARGLIAAGTAFGTRVGIFMGNRPEFVAALFGTALAGGVPVPLSTFSTEAELHHTLGDSCVAIVLAQSLLLERRWNDAFDAVDDARLPYLQHVAALGDTSWTNFVAAGQTVAPTVVDARNAQVSPADHGLILYSSGTTSTPKGMIHFHRAPCLQFWLQADIWRRSTDTRLWAPLPLFWTAGLTTALGPTLAAGGCNVLQETFDAGDAITLIERERVTEPYTLPHQTTACEEHPSWATADLSSLRHVFGRSGFARHPSVQGDPTWNTPVGFGMSETCATVVGHRFDTPREHLKNSTGRVLPGTTLKVIDPTTGESLGAGEHGELALKGSTVLDHYVGRPREDTFDDDGYLRTGDIGFVDAEGFVHWTGRRTEMIKTGGANVSPAELEVALRACTPVKRAKVVGIPDDRLGQVVVLCVVLKAEATASAEELTSFLAEKVAKYKVPKHVIFFDDGALPTTASDTKVRDDELVALVLDRLGAR